MHRGARTQACPPMTVQVRMGPSTLKRAHKRYMQMANTSPGSELQPTPPRDSKDTVEDSDGRWHWHEDIHDVHKEIGIGDGGTKDDNRCRTNLLRCMRGLGCSVFALLCMGFLIAKETSKATTTMSPKSEQQQEATNYSSSAFGSRSPLVPASPPYSPPSLLPLLPSLPTPAPAQPPPAGPCATWCLDHPRSWRHK